jgi:PDZ domain-containing protein
LAFGLLTLATLLAPLNYVLLQAGPTDNLLGENVKIKNIKSNEFKTGALYSTSVFVTSPNLKPLGIEVILAWLDGDRAVLPRDAVYENNQSPKAERALQRQEMVDSQANAAIAALNFIKQIDTYPKQTWNASDVSINLKKVGGGSGGLAFALALIAKSADPQLIAGRKIAATGTISQNGNVGEIGGIDQKILGAKKRGVEIFLMPKANCSALSKHPTGMQVYAVENLTAAVHALVGVAPTSSFTCPTK